MVVPFAPLWVKLLVGTLLGSVVALALTWGGRKLLASLRGGPGSPIFFGLVLAFGVACAFLLLAIETTGPTQLSESGILVGGGPPRYISRSIAWNEVTRVDCLTRGRPARIIRLVIYAKDQRYGLGNAGASLEAARNFIAGHIDPGRLAPCSSTFH